MTLDLRLQEDSADIFLNSGFEERITYIPSHGEAREIKALVYRYGSLSSSPANRTGREKNTKQRMYAVEIDISRKDDSEGSTQITLREDKVIYPEHYGDPATITASIVGIVQQDIGMTRVGVR